MNKVRGYTIMEMLIVMLISAVSIGITYTTYRIFSNQYLSYKRNSEHTAQYILLDKLLTTDFLKTERVIKSQEGLTAVYKSKQIDYVFTEAYILRTDHSVVDTFKIAPTAIQFQLGNVEQNIPGERIDQLSFQSVYKEEVLRYNFFKRYAADVWMMEDEDNKD